MAHTARYEEAGALVAPPGSRARPVRLPPLTGAPAAYVQSLGAALAGAASVDEVAASAAAVTATLGRAAAVGLLDEQRAEVVVRGSAGYGCDAMAPGTRIPVASGLPLVEAAARADVVVVGRPGDVRWLAVPLDDPRGALLLSDPAPGWGREDTRGLQAGVRSVADALRRAAGSEEAVHTLGVLSAQLRAAPVRRDAVPGLRLAARLLSHDAERHLGGDVLVALPDARGGAWLLVADVRGHGAEAAVLAAQLRAVAGALAPLVTGPVDLLHGLDRAVVAAQPTPGDPDATFATAVAVHVRRDDDEGGGVVVRTASAGHPLPLLRDRDGVRPLGQPGLVLGLGLHPERADLVEAVDHLGDDWLLALHSDGLVDAPVPGAGERRVRRALEATATDADPEPVADALLEVGVPGGVAAPDDVALLVAAPH